MKKVLTIAMSLVFASALAFAAPKSSSMKGWISDSKCGAKGANASHAGCAKACVKGGEKAVFVSDKDGKIYAINNQDAVKDHVGDHVTVQASIKGDAMNVNKVEAAK